MVIDSHMRESSIEKTHVVIIEIMYMHGWWVPFVVEAWTKVHRMDKAHIVLTSDPRNDFYKIDNSSRASVVMW